MVFNGCVVLAGVVCSGAVVVVGVLGVVVVVCKLVYWLLIAADGVVRDVGNYSVFFVWFRLWVSLLRGRSQTNLACTHYNSELSTVSPSFHSVAYV